MRLLAGHNLPSKGGQLTPGHALLDDAASFIAGFTGLVAGVAVIGTHASIGLNVSPAGAFTVKYSANPDAAAAATFGTGASPTAFASADRFRLYAHVTRDGETVTISAPVRQASLAFTEQSSISGTPVIGQTLTFNLGAAGPAATLEIVLLTLDGVDKTGELAGPAWDTTGEAPGQIQYRVRATSSFGSILSNLITVNLAAPVVAVTSAIADQSFVLGSGDVTIDLDTRFTNATSYTVTGAGASVAGSILTLNDDTLRAGVTITVTGSNGFNSAQDVFTLTVTEAPAIPDLVITSVGPQASGTGNVPLAYTLSVASFTYEVIAFISTETDPVAANFNLGPSETVYLDLGQATLTNDEVPLNVAIPDDLSGTYQLAFLPVGGGDVDVVITSVFDLDTQTGAVATVVTAGDAKLTVESVQSNLFTATAGDGKLTIGAA